MDTVDKILASFLGLVALVVVMVIITPLICWTGCISNYSDGMRTGDIYKFSKKGVFYKSWEGEMYLGGYHSTGGKTPTIETDKFYFSIPESQEEEEKKELIEKIKKCSQTRETCTIEYSEWLFGPMSQSDSHTVTGVSNENSIKN